MNPSLLQPSFKAGSKQTQASSLFEKGFSFHQKGKFSEAKYFYIQALELEPNYFDALQRLGLLLAQTQQYSQAIELLSKALKINPNHAECYNNRAVVLQEIGRLEEALVGYDQAIAIHPEYVDAHSNRGNVLKQLNRLDEALKSYDKALNLKPSYAVGHSNRGVVLQDLNRLDEALSSYNQAIKLNPNYAQAYNNRGLTLQRLKYLEDALASFNKAIAIKSDYAVAFNNRGNVLQELKCLDEALENYKHAISINPDYAVAYNNQGNVLKEIRHLDDALKSYNKAIHLKIDYAEAHSNRGLALQELMHLEEALISFQNATTIKPDFAEAHVNLSLCQLLKSNFKEGWLEYEWRCISPEFIETCGLRTFQQPQWSGMESLQGKTIFLYPEQGLGDTIQFSRYVALVANLGAKVFMEVQAPLFNLLAQLDGIATIVVQGDKLPEFDFQCPLLSLPLAFKTDALTIPPATTLAKIDKEKLTYWEARLGEKTKPRVGICWRGNPAHKNDQNRSIVLSELIPYLPSNCQYVSLQKEMSLVDQDALIQHGEIKNFGESIEDFTDTAALCELMDLVISVDTSVAHLAGTLEKSTWVLLPYSPDWRWLVDREDSPWYPSVKLYRQEKSNHWNKVFEQLKVDLENINHFNH